ncbi:hypothetical protein [Butyrivibrio sp. VCD2006]|uniref:hypothetical protein n=1 Tax=Butyrivibrio sp. VCD2006 TaxID=1280664 RepID=UPI00042764D7|nr:hypothetical protein [Butyrivibrio sp. VCD2006]
MSTIKKLIRQIHRKMRRSGSKGFSFAEMLFAILILLLASQLIAESLRLAAAHYLNYTNHANAQMIMPTLSGFVRSEMTTASEIEKVGDEITFFDGSGLIGGRCKIVDGDSLYLQNVKYTDKKYYPIVGMNGENAHDFAEKLEIETTFEAIDTPTKANPYWKFELNIEVFDKKGKSLTKGKSEIIVPGEVQIN